MLIKSTEFLRLLVLNFDKCYQVKLIIIMTELSLKRQKISSQIRRSQIEKYMATCRSAFEDVAQPPEEYKVQIELQPFMQQMQNQNYSQQSLLWFLGKLNECDIRKIDCTLLLVEMRKVLMHISDDEYLQSGIKIASSILSKIINQARKNNSFLNKCFHELFQLITQQKLNMFQIWPSVALIKSQIYFHISYNRFTSFIFNYSKELDRCILPILKTILHFTFKPSQHNSEAKLALSDYYQIMGIVKRFFDHYILGNQEIKIAAILCNNILQQHPKHSKDLLLLPEIVSIFLKSIDYNQETEELYSIETQEAILCFVNSAMICQKNVVMQVVTAYPRIFEVLSQKLPIQNTFNTVNLNRPIKWTHLYKNNTAYSIMALSNLAAISDFKFKMVGTEIVKKLVELSAYPNDMVKSQVTYFFWNLLVASTGEQVQILCEKDILWALRNLLQINNHLQSLLYSVKCVSFILNASQHFPSNNIAWHYNSRGVWQELERNGSIKILQNLVISDCKQTSEQAAKCLNIIRMDTNC